MGIIDQKGRLLACTLVFLTALLLLVASAENATAQQPRVCKEGKRCVVATIEFEGWVSSDSYARFIDELNGLCRRYLKQGIPPDRFAMSLHQADLWRTKDEKGKEEQVRLEDCRLYQGNGKPGGWSDTKGFRTELLEKIDTYVESKQKASAQRAPIFVKGRIRPLENGGGGRENGGGGRKS